MSIKFNYDLSNCLRIPYSHTLYFHPINPVASFNSSQAIPIPTTTLQLRVFFFFFFLTYWVKSVLLIHSCTSVRLNYECDHPTIDYTLKINSPSIPQEPSTASSSAAKGRSCDSLCGAHSTDQLCSNVDKFDLLWILFGQQQLLSLHDCDSSVMTGTILFQFY